MISKRILATVFAVLSSAAQGTAMANDFARWYNSYVQQLLDMPRTPGGGTGFVNGPDNPQPGETALYADSPEKRFSGVDDPALRAEVAQQLFRQTSGSNKSIADLGINPDQLINYYRQQGQFETRDQASPGDSLDRAMGVAVPAFIGYALGGAAGGALGGAAAGEGAATGATAGEGASYAANGNAVYDAGAGASSTAGASSAPQSFQLAQAPSATMTDVSGGFGSPQMPAAQVPADPTFGGQLQQTAPGTFSNVGNYDAFGPVGGPARGTSGVGQSQDGSKTNPDGTPATPAPAGTSPDQPAATPAKPESSLADKFKTAAYGTAAAGTIYGALSPRNGAQNGQAMANQLQETEAQRQARVAAATDSVNKAFAGYDDPYYKSIADSYKNFQMPLYNEQVTEARRTLPMSVPNTQSSAYERRARQLETDVQRGQTDLEGQALQQANSRRGEIDAQKSDLLNMATAGADASTVADAAGQRAQMYAAPPQFSPIADMFQKYSADAANFALAGNANNGGVVPSRPVTPLSFSRSPSSSQRIVA